MKVKLIIFEMEADGVAAASELNKALSEVLDAAFPVTPRVEVRVDEGGKEE